MKFILFSFLSCFFVLGYLRAQTPLLSVDFNAGAKTPSPTMVGFEQFDVSAGERTGPISISFPVQEKDYPSGIGVTLTTGKSIDEAGRLTGRVWKVEHGDFTAADLYFDAICSADGKPLVLELTGLKPSRRYQLQFYCFSPTKPGSVKITDISSGEPADSAEGEWNNEFQFSESTSESIFMVTLAADSTSGGKIIVLINNKLGTAVLNGFRILQQKP